MLQRTITAFATRSPITAETMLGMQVSAMHLHVHDFTSAGLG